MTEQSESAADGAEGFSLRAPTDPSPGLQAIVAEAVSESVPAAEREDFLATEQLLLVLVDKHPSWHVFRDALAAVHLEAKTRGCICPDDVLRLRVWWHDCPIHQEADHG